jgi:hypothetical protein
VNTGTSGDQFLRSTFGGATDGAWVRLGRQAEVDVNWSNGLVKVLILLVIIAVVARVILGLLGPLLPSLLMLAVLVVVVMSIIRGPRTKK